MKSARYHGESCILIVDDMPENLDVLRKVLSQSGYRVRPALGGEIALRAIASELPDLILLDVMMSGIDGYQVCQALRRDERTRGIPVLFISARMDAAAKVRGFEAGAVDYITKPFNAKEVLARVETHLSLRTMRKQLEEQNLRLQQEIEERKRTEISLDVANQELTRLASIDGLTQIANRRRFDEHLHREWTRASRTRTALGLVLCDIDHFKRYNDTYGHVAGDACLHEVAQAIQRSARRPADLPARYGGEEFTVLLPHTDTDGAVQIADMIREEVASLKLPHESLGAGHYVTLSMGLVSTVPVSEGKPESLVEAADKALYEAKEAGRNRIATGTVCDPRQIRCHENDARKGTA